MYDGPHDSGDRRRTSSRPTPSQSSRTRQTAGNSSTSRMSVDVRSQPGRTDSLHNGWASEASPIPSPSERVSSRLIYDGRHRQGSVTTPPSSRQSVGTGGTGFLMNVQRELEGQRESWRSEMDRLLRGTVQLEETNDQMPSLEYFPNSASDDSSSVDAGANSYVDTSGDRPLFKAFVDVSEFYARDVSVTVDKMTDKIVIKAHQSSVGAAAVSRSFTQRVQLPRYADDARLVASMNKRGILKLEVPLLFYFPPEERDMTRDGRAKSFVYEVRDDPVDHSRQLMEILVNTGCDVGADELRVEVDDTAGGGKVLLISADKSAPANSDGGSARRRVIKRYTLPELAIADDITSRLGVDGRLTILIPLQRK